MDKLTKLSKISGKLFILQRYFLCTKCMFDHIDLFCKELYFIRENYLLLKMKTDLEDVLTIDKLGFFFMINDKFIVDLDISL